MSDLGRVLPLISSGRGLTAKQDQCIVSVSVYLILALLARWFSCPGGHWSSSESNSMYVSNQHVMHDADEVQLFHADGCRELNRELPKL